MYQPGFSVYIMLGCTIKEIVVGDEYDDALFERLIAEVAALGGSINDTVWTLGGSQEMTIFEIVLPDGKIEAVAETYVGPSLRGTPSLVERLACRGIPNPLLQRDGHAAR